MPFIHRNLTIKVSDFEKLHQDVVALTDDQRGQKHLGYVRRLQLTGGMPLGGVAVKRDRTDEDDFLNCHGESEEAVEYDDLEPQLSIIYFGEPEEDGPKKSSHLWSPVATLIARFRSLTDLSYACSNRFPPCLLQALHQHHPACRLEIRTFRFRSLRDPTTDPNELALVTSPCLHSLNVEFRPQCPHVQEDYTEGAVMRTVALAPNLKHVNILVRMAPCFAEFYHKSRDVTFKPWKGFVAHVDTFRIGSLRSLSFGGYMTVSTAMLDEWGQHTDLRELRSLVLSVPGADVLTNAARNTRFPSLERLAIRFRHGHHDLDFQNAVEMFFDSLGPLTTLRLYVPPNLPMIAMILERCGCSLRELVLRPYDLPWGSYREPAMIFRSADILNIRNSCPRLEDLSMDIQRSRSDWHETQCYAALGTFPYLTKLVLHLDSSAPGQPDPPHADEDDFHKQPYESWLGTTTKYNSNIRDALINSAVDEALARSIWNVISSDKPGRPLARLKILSTGAGKFGNSIGGPLKPRIEHMSRSFLLTRSERDDSDHVEIIELWRQRRERRDKRYDAERWEKMKDPPMVRLRSIFERLWPRKPGSQDWRDDWSSWPLQLQPPDGC